MPSPACLINGSPSPQDVSAGSTVNIALAVPAGALFWSVQIIAADDLTNVATVQSSLSINTTAKTATFTAPGSPGSAVIVQSTVGIGNNSKQGFGYDANGQLLTVGAPNAAGGFADFYNSGRVVLTNGVGGASQEIVVVANTAAGSRVAIGADATNLGTSNYNASTIIEAVAVTGNRHVTALNAISATATSASNVPSGDGVTLIYNRSVVPANNPVGGALLYSESGNLWVYPSSGSKFQILSGGGSFTPGADLTGNTTVQYVQSISGANGGGGAVPVGTASHNVQLQFPNLVNQVMIEAGTQYFLANDGSNNLQINALSTVAIQSGGTALATFTGTTQPGLYPAAALTNFMLGWYSNTTTSATGAGLLLQPQFSTNANGTGGNCVVSLMAAAGSGSESYFQLSRASTYSGPYHTTVSVGAVPGSSGNTCGVWAPGVTPANNNFGVSLTNTSVALNGPTSGGEVDLAVNDTDVVTVKSGSVAFAQPLLGLGTALQYSVATQAITSGTVTLLSTVYSSPQIELTGSLTGDVTLVFPSLPGALWLVDYTGITFNGHAIFMKTSGSSAVAFTSGSNSMTLITIGAADLSPHKVTIT
jgi:hypothetical protein